MPDDYAIAELRRAYGDLFRQQRELEKRVNDLATPVDKRPELAYGQASDWLRMVNTITWTLSSIFLVGAIIAVNGASQSGVDPAWRIAAYVLVFVLCAIWWRVDWIYAQSAIKARAVLDRIEQRWSDEHAFYRSQNDPVSVKRRKCVAWCIYLPIIAVGLVAGFLALKTAYAMWTSTASAGQQQTETPKKK